MTELIEEASRMTPHTPTPEEAEHAIWLFKFWRELLTFIGASIALTLGFFKLKKRTVIPMSTKEIEHRLTIRDQAQTIAMMEELDRRDKALFSKIQEQSDRTIKHIIEIIKK